MRIRKVPSRRHRNQLGVEQLESRELLAADTVLGDANEDGVFDRLDLVQVLELGKYNSGQPATAGEGDFNCDGQFDQFDLIKVLQEGRFNDSSNHVDLPLGEGQSRTLATFDAASAELAEGVAVDQHGNVFVTFAPKGEVWKIAPDGSRSLLASFKTTAESPLPGALGLALDDTGNVYAALATAVPDSHGVWQISSDGLSQKRVPGTEMISFPNALAFDDQGNLYVTDSVTGMVWRIQPGQTAQPWIQHPLLQPNQELSPVGANGIVYREGSLLVANSSNFRLLEISIAEDGTATEPQVFYQGELGFFPDGIAVDVIGNVYVANPVLGVIQQVSADGQSLSLIASAAQGLDDPTSLTFGAGINSRQTLLVANSSFFGVDSGPSLVQIGVSAPGAAMS